MWKKENRIGRTAKNFSILQPDNNENAALSIQNLTKVYENGIKAVNNVSFEVQAGQFFALLGRNGAGKSTIIGTVCSLVNKSSGTVKVFGTDIDENFSRAKSYLGVVPQEFNFNPFNTPMHIVSYQAGFYGVPRALAIERTHKYLKALGIWHMRDKIARSLSGGMKRRLMVARALVHEPKLLILDEPTAGVDIETRHSMWGYFKQLNDSGVTVILTTHYLEDAERLCRSVGIIEQGELVWNSDMKSLTGRIQQETYLLDLINELHSVPKKFNRVMRMVDTNTAELDINRGESIELALSTLARLGIQVASVRNKANRLENLFLELTNSNRNEQEIQHDGIANDAHLS